MQTNHNFLINEKSPYLLQHANNPVEWNPWGPAAFNKAKEQDKPIFLSIGYSTCHWCHVMSHESFMNTEVAEILNNNFISIKVDREERPDIDAVYMSVCQAMTGSGGWPLNIIMTPEQKPFFAGTYLPKNSIYGRMGLTELLNEVIRLWKTNREKLNLASEKIIASIVEQKSVTEKSSEPNREIINKGYLQLKQNFDPLWGGFASAPKFPTPHNLLFLMQYSKTENAPKAMEMVNKTLEHMFRGGLFDHIGGGFSRYSTDDKWLVPHFEKMLYDNALLSYIYIEAFRTSQRPLYKTIAKKTMDYVLRELKSSLGGFYCGQDADSDGVEGKYYVFTPDEIISQLGSADAEFFCRNFGITEKGNFEGKNIPNLIENSRYEKYDEKIAQLCQKIYNYRIKRTALHKDDKVLTSWNSLMIAALARASLILDEQAYLEAAILAERFISKNLVDHSGRLLVRWREGEAAIKGHLDDYAFYVFALLELYESTFELAYLIKARHFALLMNELFFDNDNGGYYLYASDAERLISRPKEVYDGAMPSGNSVAALCLTRLASLCGDLNIQETLDMQLKFIASEIASYPAAHCFSMIAIMSAVYPSTELVCATAENIIPPELFRFLKETSYQRLNVIVKTPANSESLKEIAAYSENYKIPSQGSLYYLCINKSCAVPVDNIEYITARLRSSASQ